MSLLRRPDLLEPVETWSTLHAAAEARFWDGLDLATSEAGRHTGAIYVLGYVAEMVLKVAVFRLHGVPPYADLSPHRRGILNTYSTRRRRNLHDLEVWAEVLIDLRAIRGIPLDPGFAAQLRINVAVLVSHWKEGLRYRHTQATSRELREVFEGIDWLFTNRSLLRS
jgi:hypothetical protein